MTYIQDTCHFKKVNNIQTNKLQWRVHMFDLAQISYWMPFLTQPSSGRETALRVHKLVTPEGPTKSKLVHYKNLKPTYSLV